MTSSAQPRLVGVAEISKLFDVPRTTVSMWGSRRSTSGFPVPIERLEMGPVYDLNEVQRWHDAKYAEAEQLTIEEES